MVKNLKLLRESRGISQQKLADAVGLTQQSINKYENHKIEPDIETLIRIADFFHTTVDYLVGHTDAQGASEEGAAYRLNPDEVKLISQYRKLTLKEKDSIHLVMENYCE